MHGEIVHKYNEFIWSNYFPTLDAAAEGRSRRYDPVGSKKTKKEKRWRKIVIRRQGREGREEKISAWVSREKLRPRRCPLQYRLSGYLRYLSNVLHFPRHCPFRFPFMSPPQENLFLRIPGPRKRLDLRQSSLKYPRLNNLATLMPILKNWRY